MSQMQESYEVHLAIYDLSHGMARNLSAQFLGSDHAIDVIPHSGLVVHGSEYFFGSGIQSESPAMFRQMTGMAPIQTIYLGRTTVSRSEFETWCSHQMVSRFSPDAYDLLHNNCNSFAHAAALEGLRLSQGVPDWILQTPQRFLSSPMGQMVRPMLEQMQLRAPVNGAHSIPTETLSAPNSFPASSSMPTTSSNHAANPWAHLEDGPGPPNAPKSAPKQIPHPLLDTFAKPLLSKDIKTAPLCLNKIREVLNQDQDTTHFLQTCQSALTSNGKAILTLEQESRLGQILHICLVEKKAVTFVLMLLRLLVAERESLCPYQECLEWIYVNIVKEEQPTLSTPAKTMAWLVVSNAIGNEGLWKEESVQDDLVQASVRAMSDEANTVRQASTAFSYNFAVVRSSADSAFLSDTQVPLLCACLETLVDETDDTARLRRLMTVGRILVPLHSEKESSPAISLVMDLGLNEFIQRVIDNGKKNGRDSKLEGDAKQGHDLALEINQLLCS